MGKNLITKRYTADSTWTAPAGVTRLKAKLYEHQFPLNFNFGVGGPSGNGVTYLWGLNDSGQLGVGDVTPRSSPVAVLGGLSFYLTQAQQSNAHVLGLNTAGQLYGWGLNDSGQLGLGDVTPRSSPVAVLGGLSFKSFGVGTGLGNAAIGLTRTGILYAWGYDPNGALGVASPITARSSPIAVLGGFSWAQVTMGGSTLAIRSDGALYAWGSNYKGELGVGDITHRSSPIAVLGGLTWVSVHCGSTTNGCVGITTGGVTYAWGGNANGQLGVGDVVARSSPVAVLGGLTFKQVLCGNGFMLGITTSGQMYAWGANTNGELGLGDVTPRSSPVAVLGALLWMPPYRKLINEVEISVTPGTSYNISLMGLAPRFGVGTAETNLYGVLGACAHREIELEYMT